MIPRGFAHGFLVLSDTALFEYQVDDVYDPGYEGGLPWGDETIGIVWPKIDCPLDLSPKDGLHKNLRESKIEFGVKNGTFQKL